MKNLWKAVPLVLTGSIVGVACSPSSGNSGATGGAVAAMGGTLVVAGGAPGVGGTPTSGGALITAGGAPVTAGGAPATTGGDAGTTGGDTGAGGAAAGVTCMGTSGDITTNYVDNGTICGYAYTAAWDTATVTPEEFDDTATSLCVTGSVPAEVPAVDDVAGVYPGLAIGFGVKEKGTTKETWIVAGTSITINAVIEGVNATDDGAIRFMFEPTTAPPATDEGSSIDVGYAYWLPAGTTFPVTVPFTDFTSLPWSGAGTAVTGKEVAKFAVQIGGREAGAQTITNFCLSSVTVNP